MPLNLLAFTSFLVADKHPLKIECLDTWGMCLRFVDGGALAQKRTLLTRLLL